jgi:hypothetical protein
MSSIIFEKAGNKQIVGLGGAEPAVRPSKTEAAQSMSEH